MAQISYFSTPLTGLIWLKDANCLGGVVTRSIALSYAKTITGGAAPFIGDCGLSDNSPAGSWRLPNRFELESLLDLSQSDPALPAAHPFNNVQLASYYWTSSYNSYYTDLSVGWSVLFSAGDVATRSWELDPCYVWFVRDKLE